MITLKNKNGCFILSSFFYFLGGAFGPYYVHNKEKLAGNHNVDVILFAAKYHVTLQPEYF